MKDEPPRLPGHGLAFRELATLRELRRLLGRGRLPAPDHRTPEDCARIASFRTVEELLGLLDEFERRVGRGERCRLVEREHRPERGRLVIEFSIEARP